MSPVKILLYGPPGAGKDTQGVRLAAHFSVPFIAVGELCRKEIAEGSALGTYIAPYMAKGIIALGSPSVIIREQIVQKGLGEIGYVVNGFRTVASVKDYLTYDSREIIARRLAQYHDEGEKALRHFRAYCPDIPYREIYGAGTEDEVRERILFSLV